MGAVAPVPILTSVDGSTNEMTGHNLPDIPPRSESPVQWQGRIKPTESHIADLKAKDWTDITPGFRTPMSGSSEPGGIRPPILKFSFQNPLSSNRKRHRTLCSNSTGGYALGVSSGLATDRGF